MPEFQVMDKLRSVPEFPETGTSKRDIQTHQGRLNGPDGYRIGRLLDSYFRTYMNSLAKGWLPVTHNHPNTSLLNESLNCNRDRLLLAVRRTSRL